VEDVKSRKEEGKKRKVVGWRRLQKMDDCRWVKLKNGGYQCGRRPGRHAVVV
jgi:hypothetical protein